MVVILNGRVRAANFAMDICSCIICHVVLVPNGPSFRIIVNCRIHFNGIKSTK